MNRKRVTLALLLLPLFVLTAAQSRPDHKPDHLAQGKKLYNNQCALCHGIGGTGGRGPALNQPKLRHAPTQAALIKVIQEGIPGTEMPSFAIASPALPSSTMVTSV